MKKCRGFVSENGRLERHQYCPLEPHRVRSIAQKKTQPIKPCTARLYGLLFWAGIIKIRLRDGEAEEYGAAYFSKAAKEVTSVEFALVK